MPVSEVAFVRAPMRAKPLNGAPNGAPALPAASPGPTREAPFRGLDKLAALVVSGRDRILEIAARPVVYAWQDVALAGTIVLLAGCPSSGKTTLLFLLLMARANLSEPVNVLGRKVTPAPEGKFVVLIEAEQSERSTCAKLVRSCKTLGVDDGALERIKVFARKAIVVHSPEWIELERLISTGLVSDIALDTLARVAPGEANDEAAQVATFERITKAIELAPGDDKPIVWIVGHTRKSDSTGLADVSGSVQRTGQCDSVLMIVPEVDDGRVVASKCVFAKLREEPQGEYPKPVTYTVTSEGIVYPSAPVKDDRPIEVRILELLKSGPKTKNQVREAVKRNEPAVQSAIRNLFTEKRILTTPVIVRGREYPGFKLWPASERPSPSTGLSPDSYGPAYRTGLHRTEE